MRAAVFLDRDGVINHDPGDYTPSLAAFTLLPGFLTGLAQLVQWGYAPVVITNQGGIAKGLYSHVDVEAIHQHLRDVCAAQGTPLLDIFYSPHHPDHGNSLSRKPGSLLVERALAKHQLDAGRSWMIGDKQRDLDAAAGAGVRGLLVPTNAPLVDHIAPLAPVVPVP